MDGIALTTAVLGLVALVERSVGFLRSLVITERVPSQAWPVIAVVVGVAYCVGWQVNLAGQAMVLVPALAGEAGRLDGVAGQVMTGLVIGSLAGPLHELVDALRAKAGKQ